MEESLTEGEYDLLVRKVVFGDLFGTSDEVAVVHTSCAASSNFGYNNIYIFKQAPAGTALVAHLAPSDWGAGEEDNGGLFRIADVQVRGQFLEVTFDAGGSHAEPAWLDTAKFKWNGHEFIRVELVRKSYLDHK